MRCAKWASSRARKGVCFGGVGLGGGWMGWLVGGECFVLVRRGCGFWGGGWLFFFWAVYVVCLAVWQ
jgi:hypothetical protein